MLDVALAKTARDTWKSRVDRMSLPFLLCQSALLIFAVARGTLGAPDWVAIIVLSGVGAIVATHGTLNFLFIRAEVVLTEAIIADRDREIAP